MAPEYTISGPNTGLSGPDDVVVTFSGQLYVTNGFGRAAGSVTVYAPGASGNAAPVQDISGSSTDLGSFLDDLTVDGGGDILVTDSTASVGPAVLGWPSGATGDVAPTTVIAGAATTFDVPEGVALAPPPPPTLTTKSSSSQVAVGGTVSDTATIQGADPAGSIVFKAFGPNDPTCTAAPAYTSPAQTVSGNGSYSSPSFSPAAAGTYSWQALYSGDRDNAPATTACNDPAETFTAKAPTITLTGTPVSATEGQAFSGQVASFTDTNTSSTAAEYSATINWGDGASSAGTVSGPTGGPYTVTGTHTYAEEGSYTVQVSITDTTNSGNDLSTKATATVADAPLGASCATPAASQEGFSGTVASLTDANPGATTADYTATISWGDGTSSAGVVSGPTGGPFTVSGTHTYTSTGSHAVGVTIADDGGSKASATGCQVVVYAFAPGGGSFVIGDRNSAQGSSVEFWGAQWAKNNSLSGGPAPAAFKGFALQPTTPACGATWTTGPGNSPPPPSAPLPAYMAVIVTSQASQSGTTISGNTIHVVVVRTNPGYQPDPGHPGTGTVVAQIC